MDFIAFFLSRFFMSKNRPPVSGESPVETVHLKLCNGSLVPYIAIIGLEAACSGQPIP